MKVNIFVFAAIIFLHSQICSQVQQEWVRIFDGQLHYWDDPSGIVADDSGNVYIGGTSAGNGGDKSSIYEYVTFKYDPAGQLKWLSRYNGDPNMVDWLIDIQIDNSSNVYVTGMSYITQQQTYDWASLKYNNNGQQQWLRTYGVDTNLNDERPCVMKIDINSNIYITGWVARGITKIDIALIKYNSSGQLLWQAFYNRIDSTFEDAKDMSIDNLNNIYVTGYTQDYRFGEWGSTDAVLLKYNSNGNLLWSRIYNSPNDTFDNAECVAVDNSGNAIISGHTTGMNHINEIFVIKYSSGGQQLWVKVFNGNRNYYDYIKSKLLTDSYGNIYLISTTYNSVQGNDDIFFVKMNSSGNIMFSRTYNSTSNKNDRSNNAIRDKFNNVYILGTVDMGIQNGGEDILLSKYSATGDLIWDIKYSGPGGQYDNDDIGISLCMDSSFNVFVTGAIQNGNTSTDIITIKYSQIIGIQPISNEIPKSYSLHQNFQNPFNPITKIKIDIGIDSRLRGNDKSGVLTKLIISDILGREIATLVNEQLNPGVYEVEWDGTNYPSGVYFYRLSAQDYSETRKMVLLK